MGDVARATAPKFGLQRVCNTACRPVAAERTLAPLLRLEHQVVIIQITDRCHASIVPSSGTVAVEDVDQNSRRTAPSYGYGSGSHEA